MTFRLIFGEPQLFPHEDGPPSGLHRIVFTQPVPFDENELRRLSPAVDFYRSLIGVRANELDELYIWGLVHSGPRWLQEVLGGRSTFRPLPPHPVLRISGPGHISVDKGSTLVCSLEGGKLSGASVNVFQSEWLQESLAPVRLEIERLHAAARGRARKEGETWAELSPEIHRRMGEHMINRLVSTVRNSNHGATLVIVPDHRAEELSAGEKRYISLKHRLVREETRWQFVPLLVRIMNSLAREYGSDPNKSDRCATNVDGADVGRVGWKEYEASTDRELSEVDEAIFEISYLVAGLSAVDGAVLMTQRVEILGFGGEISGAVDDVPTVWRALDVEGEQRVAETTESVGTRHRSAYRLCNELHDALVIVISQDGSIRFVKWMDEAVTYWDQSPAGAARG